MTHSPTTTPSLARRLREEGVDAVSPQEDGVGLPRFNLAIEHRPDAVVRPATAEGVAAAVRFAAAHGLGVTAVGRGHGFLRGIRGGIAIDTSRLAGVTVDPSARTARVGAGTSWERVIEAAAAHGLAPLAGSAPHVGVVGYVLGGGLGPVARTFGFAADHVREVTVVTAGGAVLVVDHETHADLFWALRGGKHGLGIVTEVVLDLFALRVLQGGGFYFDGADAAAVLNRFVEWSATVPDSVSTSVALLRLPPLPELPAPIRGRFVVHVRVAVVGDEDADALVAPLREVATPLMDVFGEMPYAALGMIHADPVAPMPVADAGVLLRGLDGDAVRALLEVAGPDVDAPLAAVELRLLGGAVAREPVWPNAVGGRDAGFSLHVVGAPVPELLDEVVPSVVAALFEQMAPWSTGTCQANFVGGANDADALDRSWSPSVAERLDDIRRRYDPTGVFRAAQPTAGGDR
ncbi:hypothetical protein F4692_003265 [Nocardioides cavernae]|uniref:FAD-binding PCMH-type domain-containing protein n=1 Tax=Nocardioides cavernae TaxID=1921566 RepID=A0A7Y9H579_9ACTN|nr:FAD-binding protein [Nocardioides cavernae]NYE38120.1 hypothetical protein [Nocardioides cavernae]